MLPLLHLPGTIRGESVVRADTTVVLAPFRTAMLAHYAQPP